MAGETEQEKGREGARLAKKWLDRTTRVNAHLVNPDEFAVRKLTLKKANQKGGGKTFSYDLGGYLRGENIEGQGFLAECKNYAVSGDLGSHYRLFLAHCYRAVAVDHILADNFFWISFAPFNVTKWDTMTEPSEIRSAVLSHMDVNFSEGSDPESEFDAEIAMEVSRRLWILILSKKQVEFLTLTREHHGIIEKYIIDQAG